MSIHAENVHAVRDLKNANTSDIYTHSEEELDRKGLKWKKLEKKLARYSSVDIMKLLYKLGIFWSFPIFQVA